MVGHWLLLFAVVLAGCQGQEKPSATSEEAARVPNELVRAEARKFHRAGPTRAVISVYNVRPPNRPQLSDEYSWDWEVVVSRLDEIDALIEAFKSSSRLRSMGEDPSQQAVGEVQERKTFYDSVGKEIGLFRFHIDDLESLWGPRVKSVIHEHVDSAK